MDEQQTSARDDLWDKRWLLLASYVSILVAVVIAIATQPTHWDWPLLPWGLAVGLVGVALLQTSASVAARRQPPSPAQMQRWRRRRVIYYSGWLYFGGIAGLLAAAFNLPWIVIGLAAWAAVCLLAGAVAVWTLARRRAQPNA